MIFHSPRDEVMKKLKEAGIDSPPVLLSHSYHGHLMKMGSHCLLLTTSPDVVSTCLPQSLDRQDLKRILDAFRQMAT